MLTPIVCCILEGKLFKIYFYHFCIKRFKGLFLLFRLRGPKMNLREGAEKSHCFAPPLYYKRIQFNMIISGPSLASSRI